MAFIPLLLQLYVVLCTLFALYSITPFFSCYLKGGRKNILYTLFFATLFSSLTALTWKLNPIKNGAVCASSLLYYIMGFLIFKTDIIKLKIRYAFFIIPATICFYLIYLFYGNEKLGNSYQSIFGVAYISCIVFLMRFINLKANNIIEFIGKRTLAIYVLQGPIYKAFDRYLPQIHEIGIIYPVIVLCTCLGITYVFEKNKITKFIISI